MFKPKNEVTAASKRAIAAVESQEGHSIIYLSRKLSLVECNYSNVENEALTIVWSMQRAQIFLLDKQFLLKSDQKPLEFLFNLRK